ncbi:proline utilization trans-activator-like protein [Dichotomopilus funicola]|uniref:Proline utilization trans-activator-like protein n=1 Tax=Dichotomopilus funicola TaxID=1934379 RepID=A0AAN6V0F7_9PEZI|nr:proline utilization trans-activator-like protein [Dichotomopilus funicola]
MSAPKRPRRLFAACHRCHSQKIKCSGEQPCRSCVAGDRGAECTFPAKERKIAVPESYLRNLEADSKRLRAVIQSQRTQNPTPESHAASPGPGPARNHDDDDDALPLSPEETRMLNPLFDAQPSPPLAQQPREPSSEPGFIGEASCAAFSNRMLQCLDGTYAPSTAGFSHYYRLPPPPPDPSARLPISLEEEICYFPERMHAKLLLNVARRFIGNYHPLFLEVTFMRELDAVYRRQMTPSTLWLCKFYALMALGETYTNRRGVLDSNRVPGTAYYVRAVHMHMQLLQDVYEEPSLMQVEVLTLLAWASNILGRVRTAFGYSGTAMRLALSMGLNRATPSHSPLSPVERESRRRTWWVLYFFERFSASKLGQPITVRDEDIDTEMPSMDGLTDDETAEFLDPVPICTNIKLARIIGNILTDIYGIPKSTRGLCIHRVHGILKQLREWHDELPKGMRIRDRGTPRPVASLHLAYNQCIIQTTRPILLHLFKTQFQLGGQPGSSSTKPGDEKAADNETPPRKHTFSSITLALADSCVNAALASSRTVESLFLDGSIATFGYWDAHHIFSAALILIMSTMMKRGPSTSTTATAATTSEALETLLSILRSMKHDGNIPAVDFCERLAHIQARVATLRPQREIQLSRAPSPAPVQDGSAVIAMQQQPVGMQNTMAMPLATTTNNGMGGGAGNGNGTTAGGVYGDVDILGNPLIGTFLDEIRAPPPWPDALLAEDGTLREFASEIEEQFLFAM